MADEEEKVAKSPLIKDGGSTKYGISNVSDLGIKVLNGSGESIDFSDIYGSKPKTIIVFLRHFL